MIELVEVKSEHREFLWNVLQKYLYEMTNYYDDEMDEMGNYHYRYFDAYFTESERCLLYTSNGGPRRPSQGWRYPQKLSEYAENSGGGTGMVGRRPMKNPLRMRLLRELRSEIGKYMVIFLLLVGTIGFVSGFLVADGSMLRAYNEGFETVSYTHLDVYKRQAAVADGALL